MSAALNWKPLDASVAPLFWQGSLANKLDRGPSFRKRCLKEFWFLAKKCYHNSQCPSIVHSIQMHFFQASDAKSVARDCYDNTESLISKLSKLHKTVESVADGVGSSSGSAGRSSPFGRNRMKRNRTRSPSSSSGKNVSSPRILPDRQN